MERREGQRHSLAWHLCGENPDPSRCAVLEVISASGENML